MPSNNETFNVILLVFVCYRIANLFTIDLGPYNVFKRFRRAIGKRASEEQFAGDINGTWTTLGEFVNCPHCVGLWVAAALATLVATGSIEWLLFTIAIAGAQSFLVHLVSE